MKTLTLDQLIVREPKKHSLAGLLALTGDLHAAARMATKEGELLYSSEVRQFFSDAGIENGNTQMQQLLSDDEVAHFWKAVCCVAASWYGKLDGLIEYSKDKPDILKYLLDDLNGKEDRDVCALGIAVKNVGIAQKILDHLMGDDLLEPEFAKILLQQYSSLVLSKEQKRMLIRAATSGNLSTEKIDICEILVGRNLTEREEKRFQRNRFRENIEMDVTSAPEFIWCNLKRSLSSHEKMLLRQDLEKTISERKKP